MEFEKVHCRIGQIFRGKTVAMVIIHSFQHALDPFTDRLVTGQQHLNFQPINTQTQHRSSCGIRVVVAN